MKKPDLSGKKINMITIIKQTKSPAWYLCRCECEKEFEMRRSDILKTRKDDGRYRLVSCGCSKKGRKPILIVSSDAIDTMYNRWKLIMNKCYNKNHHKYKGYGGRGIKVHSRWNRYTNFYKDMGDPPFKGATIDRINNDGDYEPSNCRWATDKQQGYNKRNTVILKFKEKSHSLLEWEKITGIKKETLQSRDKKGWSIRKILTTPVNDFINSSWQEEINREEFKSMNNQEANIVINEVTLTPSQAMVIRVAIENFSMDLKNDRLGNDKLGRSLTDSYQNNIIEIRKLIHNR